MNSGRLIGIFATIVGLGVAAIGGLWLASQTANESLEIGGALLGALLMFAFVAPIMAFGVYMYLQGGKEDERNSEMASQRQLLEMIQARGQIPIHDAAITLNVNVDTVKDMIYSLVGLQVYSGYINWDKGILYSADAKALHDLNKCENCGGQIELAGKGIIACPYCGTEYFLAS